MGKYLSEKEMRDALFRRTEGYAAGVRTIYREVFSQIIEMVKGTELEDGKPFSFAAYGYNVTPVLRTMYSRIYQTVRKGVENEWRMSNDRNDELVKTVFGASSAEDDHFARYFSRNKEAMDAFLARRTGSEGLNLSQRVWRYTGRYKEELEDSLDLALGEGTPANSLAARIKKYLDEPDRFYRRFRVKTGVDADGNPVYGRKWKRRTFDRESGLYVWVDDAPSKYTPGRGVYRSSSRNAQRLARTETNIAYRTADYERWQELDFVVGMEIKLSNNHPESDICDALAGRYPKDFKWTGWHPNCRCYMVPVLASKDEVDEMVDRILDGGDPDAVEVAGAVSDTPEQFDEWAKDNVERAEKSFAIPSFVKDNLKYFPEGYDELYAAKIPYDTYAEYQAAMKFNQKNARFTPEIKANCDELSKALPVVQGKIMNFAEAGGHRGNPHYRDSDAAKKGYKHNCAICTVAYELRRRGFPVEAMPNPLVEGYKRYRIFSQFYARNGVECFDRWQTLDRKKATYNWSGATIKVDSIEAKQAFIESMTKAVGRYEIHVTWDAFSAHVFCVERQADGNLLWFDPQSGRKGGAKVFRDFLFNMHKDKIGVLRVDDKLINPKFAKWLLRASQ